MSGQGRPDLAVVDAADLTLAIACTRWHTKITDSLLDRAAKAAKACGVTDLLTVRTAGAVELPVVAQERMRRPVTRGAAAHKLASDAHEDWKRV